MAVAVHSSAFPLSLFIKSIGDRSLTLPVHYSIPLFDFHVFRPWGDGIRSVAAFDGGCSSQFCGCILHRLWACCKRCVANLIWFQNIIQADKWLWDKLTELVAFCIGSELVAKGVLLIWSDFKKLSKLTMIARQTEYCEDLLETVTMPCSFQVSTKRVRCSILLFSGMYTILHFCVKLPIPSLAFDTLDLETQLHCWVSYQIWRKYAASHLVACDVHFIADISC